MSNDLLANLAKLHTTELGRKRILKNLELAGDEDAVAWCLRAIENPETISRTGKNWYVRGDGFVIVVNAYSFTIITARREKKKKGGSLDGVGIIKKLADLPDLKEKLIEVFDTKTHRNVSRYSLLLADHVLELAKLPLNEALTACYDVNRRWQDGAAGFQEARQVAFIIHRLAREEKNQIREKALRVLGQVAATPHVKRHALIASDYAVKLINLLYPGDLDAVREERELQIKLMTSV